MAKKVQKEGGGSNYFRESFQELHKVTWPTRNQSIRLTLIVLGVCLVSAVVLGLVDLGSNQGYRLLVNYAATLPSSTPPASPLTTTSQEVVVPETQEVMPELSQESLTQGFTSSQETQASSLSSTSPSTQTQIQN